MNNVEHFKNIVETMAELYERKNADYGDSFNELCNEFGLTAPAIRLTDKLIRFKQLINQPAQVKSENIEDTLIDLANYAIMTVMWMDKNGNISSKQSS